MARSVDQDHKALGVNGAPPRRGVGVGGPGEGMHYFGRGQLEVDDGEEILEERGVGWRVLHSPWPVAGSSFQGLLPSPSIVTLSPWHFLTPASWQPRHAHTSGFLSLSSPAPPLTLASWKDPGSGQSALQELEGGRDDRLPFGELPAVTMPQAPSPITTPTLGQVSSPKATVSGILFIADPPFGGTHFSVPPDGGRSRCQGPALQEMLGIWILLLAVWL